MVKIILIILPLMVLLFEAIDPQDVTVSKAVSMVESMLFDLGHNR